MTKCISFCLYGNNPIYLEKFKKNISFYTKYFINYKIFLFATENFKNELDCLNYNNIFSVRYMKEEPGSSGMMWRYIPILESQADVCFIRDVDYLPTKQEIQLIEEFINSEYSFHILRAHYDHVMPIMGGLFGIKKNLFEDFKIEYTAWKIKNIDVVYNTDQLFLAKYIYYKIVNKSLIHTSNVAFLNEKYKKFNLNENLLIGGDIDRHIIDQKKINQFRIYPPVWLCNIFNFRYICKLYISTNIN